MVSTKNIKQQNNDKKCFLNTKSAYTVRMISEGSSDNE